MATGPTVGHYHFEGWELPTKYDWMHNGPGSPVATEVQDITNRMAGRMINSGDLVGGLLGGAHWAGAAAGAAGQAMQRGAGQIDQTAVQTATAQRCISELGESFRAAQYRVPAPNEVPTGLGDGFLYGAAEAFNAMSPFDVQSPLHEAMTQRRELDQQANLALTNHMSTSRDRVEAMPIVAAPAPMTVTGQLAAVSGGGARQPGTAQPARLVSVARPGGAAIGSADVPAAAGFGGVPTTTMAAGWAGGPDAPQAGPGPGIGAPSSPGAGPANTGLVGTGLVGTTGGGGTHRPRSGAVQSTGNTAFGPSSSARAETGGAAARGRAGLGVRPGAGGDGIPSRDAPGRDGGAATPGPRGSGVNGAGVNGAGVNGAGVNGAGTSGTRIGGGSRADAGSFLQPPVGGRGSSADDTEHRDRYAQQADHIVGELPLVAPAVIGEENSSRGRDGR